jgi:hypothetical protein
MIMQNPYTPATPNIPPALASILSMGTAPAPMGVPQQPAMPMGMASGMGGQQTFAPSYQAGGMIGQGGMPEPMGVG